MNITQLCQLDMTEVRQIIADILALPNHVVFDPNDFDESLTLDEFMIVSNTAEFDIGTEILYDDKQERQIASTLKEITISVNAYGPNAYTLLCKLTDSMRLTPVWMRLKRLKMGYLRSSKVELITTEPAVVQAQNAQVDLIFSINQAIAVDVKRGDSVNFKLEVTK